MKRRMLAVLVAFALAILGCLAVISYVHGADRRALAGRQAVHVLLANKRIPAGTSAARVRTGGYLNSVVMPAAAVPPGALDKLPPTMDSLATTADIQPSQLILQGMFGEPAKLTGGLALPEGKLAVSVSVTTAARVAGFVKPGSTVAIFDSFTVAEGKGRVPSGDIGLSSNHLYNQATRMVLPRVEVLAVGEQGSPNSLAGGNTTSSSDKSSAKDGATLPVTVGVTQAEAERLIHAAQTGSIYLALLDDTATVRPGPGVDNNTLYP